MLRVQPGAGQLRNTLCSEWSLAQASCGEVTLTIGCKQMSSSSLVCGAACGTTIVVAICCCHCCQTAKCSANSFFSLDRPQNAPQIRSSLLWYHRCCCHCCHCCQLLPVVVPPLLLLPLLPVVVPPLWYHRCCCCHCCHRCF